MISKCVLVHSMLQIQSTENYKTSLYELILIFIFKMRCFYGLPSIFQNKIQNHTPVNFINYFLHRNQGSPLRYYSYYARKGVFLNTLERKEINKTAEGLSNLIRKVY